MITIHHLLVSQSERVIWLMEELGLPYELKSYPRNEIGMAPSVFLELHPIGSAPVIQDGELTMAESLAIFTYILNVYGDGRLQVALGEPGYADYVYWFHYANAGLLPEALEHLFSKLRDNPNDPLADLMRGRLARHLGMIDDRLSKHDYVAGDQFTAADILLQFPFGTLSTFYAALDISGHPHIRAWLNRISQRPAYQKAMKIAGHERDPAAAA